jgi:hypothetical protein
MQRVDPTPQLRKQPLLDVEREVDALSGFR